MTDEITRFRNRQKAQEQFIATSEYTQSLLDKIAKLSNSVTELTNAKTELENKVTELEKQIEKMRCCGNCKHDRCGICVSEIRCENFEQWEPVEE